MPITADTTAAQTVQFTAQFDTANATNALRLRQLFIKEVF